MTIPPFASIRIPSFPAPVLIPPVYENVVVSPASAVAKMQFELGEDICIGPRATIASRIEIPFPLLLEIVPPLM